MFLRCCILSKFYIKPQRRAPTGKTGSVVSYRNSTSNHNTPAAVLGSSGLYLIEILHQTTTIWQPSGRADRCILSKFYIKPQPHAAKPQRSNCCILSKFYIKPQLAVLFALLDLVVSYRNSTSNHNYFCDIGLNGSCILSKFYIKPQRAGSTGRTRKSCILSKFYIKPQHIGC